jgi:hypothetical protein
MNQVLDHVPRKVSNEMNSILTAPYEASEIKDALFQMFPTKAPGSYSYPAHFFRGIGMYVVRRLLGLF